MRASGLVKPNAIRVRFRILVLVDSMSDFGRSCSRAASMMSADALAEGDEFGDAAAGYPRQPPVLRFFAGVTCGNEDGAQASLSRYAR